MRWYDGGKFFAGGEYGVMDCDGLPVLIFGQVVWVEYISGYDNIILKLQM